MENIHQPDSSIVVPASYTIQFCLRGGAFVVAAPPGIDPTPEGLIRPRVAIGMFTFDDEVSWPDRRGVIAARAYLNAAWPLCFQFCGFADAYACHSRLKREQAS